MAIDNKYFTYCDELGIMKENTSPQTALDTLIKELKNTKNADPKFVEAVSKLTLNSHEVSVRACVLYHYSAEIDYVVNGNIKSCNISDFGHSGVHKALHLSEYSGKGDYRIIESASEVPYQIYNDNNLFTYDDMKNALTNKIGEKLPNNYTSFKSRSWSVSAFFVPVLVIIMKHNNKEYQMYYNLQNGYYHWAWPNDPAVLNKGKNARAISTLIRVGAFALNAITLLVALISGTAIPIVIAIATLIINIVVARKNKKSLSEFQNIYLKDRNKSMVAGAKSSIAMAVIALVGLIFALVA